MSEHSAEIDATCPTECVEANHPGVEHEQWLLGHNYAEVVERVRVLEEQIKAVITAVHLQSVSAKPTSDWLDKVLAGIREQSILTRVTRAQTGADS